MRVWDQYAKVPETSLIQAWQLRRMKKVIDDAATGRKPKAKLQKGEQHRVADGSREDFRGAHLVVFVECRLVRDELKDLSASAR